MPARWPEAVPQTRVRTPATLDLRPLDQLAVRALILSQPSTPPAAASRQLALPRQPAPAHNFHMGA